MKIKRIDLIQHPKKIPVFDIVNVGEHHNFAVQVGEDKRIVCHNCSMLDELNFAPGSNAAFEKSKIMQTYASVKARIKSRFVKDGKLLGRMFLVSSKRAEQDFLEVYLQKRKKEAANGELFVVDEPLWVVKPSNTYSGKKFQVAYGSKQLMPQIVGENDDIEAMKRRGFEILDVPIEFRGDFELNIFTALQDLAGIALPGTTSYFSYTIFSKCYVDKISPWTNEVLQIGLDDHMEYEEFFDITQIPKNLHSLPIAVHVDTALKHDLLGMSAVAYLKNIVEDTDDGLVEKRVYEHLFSVGIQAPPGSEISLAKTRRFIYRMRAMGLNIVIVSTDTFQSAEFHQLLRDKGFETAIRSLDRTPEGYQILREAMIEKRISLIRHSRLENELIHLQRDTVTGKLDHPPDGCFVGETEIRMVDGSKSSILDLMKKNRYQDSWVYTVNEMTGKIEPKRIRKAFFTKVVDELVEITFDTCTTIRCTPDHRFMLQNGFYMQAKQLFPGILLKSDDPRRPGRVIRIDCIKVSCAVYDLEIEDNHNFLLDAGVFVHNSKDISDSLAGAVWDLSLLPYQPGLSNFRIEYDDPTDNLPECFRNMGGSGLQLLDKYRFDRM